MTVQVKFDLKTIELTICSLLYLHCNTFGTPDHILHLSLQSFVAQNTYLEIYSIYLYYKGVFMDSIHTESRHWYTKLLMTPLLPHVPFTVNRKC